MNQTSTDAHPVDLEALRLQLEADGRVYHGNPNSEEAHEQLRHTLQTNDCREIITSVVDGGDVANVFASAAYRGHIDVLEAFLNHGMNIDSKDEVGCTALICASGDGHEECVRLLLDRKASLNVQNNIGFTALMQVCRTGHTNIVEILLENNAHPDLQNIMGMTALMLASVKGQEEIVQLLLNHGADIELKNTVGMTALDFAKTEEIKEMIRNHVTASYLLK